MLTFIIIFLICLAVTVLPGYLLYWNFFQSESEAKETILGICLALSLPVLATIHFITFAFHLPVRISNIGLYAAIVLLCFIRIKVKGLKAPSVINPVSLLFVLYSLYCVLQLAILPNYFLAYNYDWKLYYPNVLVYLHNLNIGNFLSGLPFEYLVKRTPFFSLTNSFYLSFFESSYANYQVTCTFLNSFIFWGFYFVAKQFFNKKTQHAVLMLLPLIPIVTARVNFPIPKALAFFLILISLVFYFRLRTSTDALENKRSALLCFITSITAFMVHPLSLLYVAWIFVDQMVLRFFRTKEISRDQREVMAKRLIFGSHFVLSVVWMGPADIRVGKIAAAAGGDYEIDIICR